MKPCDVTPSPGATQSRKRVGRGIGSGHGKTSTRGHKGQKARSKVRPGFEGGQTPLYRRLRKRRGISQTAMPRGFLHREYSIINVGQLERFEAGTEVTPELLLETGLVSKANAGLRVLGHGEVTKALKVRAHHFSDGAQKKLVAAGGQAEVI
jgi:large subunit ribosomal protein L15